MHRAVWVRYNGVIPEGCVIHHVDHDRANNDVSNLECMTAGEHGLHHSQEHTPERKVKFQAAGQAAAPAWHASAEGRAWHAVHAKESWAAIARVECTCTWCGKKYDVVSGMVKRGFCSPSCQGMARKASGVDDEQRSCSVCGTGFACNRYAKTKTCSKSCWREAIGRAKRGLQH